MCLACADPPGVLTPWYYDYREEFLRVLRFSDHEALDHPVACESICLTLILQECSTPVPAGRWCPAACCQILHMACDERTEQQQHVEQQLSDNGSGKGGLAEVCD
jgi:hypothetical protein